MHFQIMQTLTHTSVPDLTKIGPCLSEKRSGEDRVENLGQSNVVLENLVIHNLTTSQVIRFTCDLETKHLFKKHDYSSRTSYY
jgi:hypothetical protein